MSLMRLFKRCRHTARKPIKVAIIGGAGRLGKHLALLLKQNNDITEIALHDIVDPSGVREDLSHIDYNAWMMAYKGDECLPDAVACSQLVVITGGKSRSANTKDREDLFPLNAEFIANCMTAIAATNDPMPFIHIVTNPLNSLVPLAAEVLTSLKKYDPRKLSGSTTIDTVRARTFIGQLKGKDPMFIKVPVIGGHSTNSVLPLISKVEPDYDIDTHEAIALIERTRCASFEVADAYHGKFGSFMTASYAVAIFCNSVIQAILGKTVKEVAYIPCKVVNGLDYFSTSFTMDADGVKDIDPVPELCSYERPIFEATIKDIRDTIKMAKDFSTKLTKDK